MFYIYILISKTSNKYYIGYSNNPWERVIQHNENTGEKYTGKYKNWELISVFKVLGTRGDAMKIEKFIKNQKSRNFIEKIIDDNFKPEGKLAQLVRVPNIRD